MRQLLQNATVITKCDSYYKMRQFYYKMLQLLQIATVQDIIFKNNRIHKHMINFTTFQAPSVWTHKWMVEP